MRGTSNDFVTSAAVELASLSSLTRTRASALMGIEDSYVAWCVDEAVALVALRLRRGDRLKIQKTTDNHALLKKLGVK